MICGAAFAEVFISLSSLSPGSLRCRVWTESDGQAPRDMARGPSEGEGEGRTRILRGGEQAAPLLLAEASRGDLQAEKKSNDNPVSVEALVAYVGGARIRGPKRFGLRHPHQHLAITLQYEHVAALAEKAAVPDIEDMTNYYAA